MRLESLGGGSLSGGPTPAQRSDLTRALSPGRARLLGAGLLQALAILAFAAIDLAIAGMAQTVLDGVTSWSRDSGWLSLMAGAAIIRALASLGAARLAGDGALAVEAELRTRLLGRLLRGAPALDAGAQATALMDEVDQVGAFAERYWPARIAAVIAPLGLLAAVFPQNWLVGVMLLLCAPLPPINLSVVGMGTATVAARHGEQLRHLSGYFLDRLRGLSTLRALGAEADELERVTLASTRLADSSMAVLRVAFVSAAVLEAIVTVAVAVIASYVGLTLLGYVQIPGLPAHMSLQTGLFLLLVTPLYFQPVRTLAGAYHERADAIAAMGAISDLLASGAEIEPAASTRRLVRPPAVTVGDLTVRFAGREQPALEGVNLTIAPGEVLGLAGVSGAGKSTLLRVLAGDLAQSAGTVHLDGVVPAAITRTSITWLGQRPRLFDASLAENIALGRPDAAAQDVHDAALAAGLGALLERLPEGLGTAVGEGGWGLSGGEAHRVALARTFLAASPLLLLDEPTAHLDAFSEAGVLAVIDTLSRGATTVLASHSPRLLGICDRVLVLDRGRLVEPGVAAGAGGRAVTVP